MFDVVVFVQRAAVRSMAAEDVEIGVFDGVERYHNVRGLIQREGVEPGVAVTLASRSFLPGQACVVPGAFYRAVSLDGLQARAIKLWYWPRLRCGSLLMADRGLLSFIDDIG